MESFNLAAVFVIGMVGHVFSYSNAKLKWQMGDTAAAWEHQNGYDAIYPSLSDPVKVGVGHPHLNFKSFSFDGIGDYVHSNMKDNDKFKTFSILLFVNPASSSGPLLHYKYGSGGQDGIDSVKVTYSNGEVEVEVVYDSHTWTDVLPASLVTSAWQYVLVYRDMDNAKVGMDVNGNTKIFGGPPKETVEYLGSPGEFWFGRNDDTGNLYHGKMTCVLFFDYVFDPFEMDDAYSECNGLPSKGPSNVVDEDMVTATTTSTDTTTTTFNTPSTTPTTVTTTQITTTITSTSKYALWLLDDRTYAYQTDGTAPVYPHRSQCCRLGGASPDIPGRKSLLFDGSSICYFELPLTLGFLQGNFQIAFLVYGAYPSSGTLLHFRYTGIALGIRELHMSVSSGMVLLTVQDATHECGYVRPSTPFTSDVWHFVIIERDTSQLSLHIDSSTYTSTDTCSAGSSGDTSESLVGLGNSAALDDPLRGRITCLGVYDRVLTVADRQSQHKPMCTSPSTSVPFLDKSLCFPIPDIRHIQYSVRGSGQVPIVGVPPIMTSQTLSLRHCGKMCVETRHCLAFTFSEDNFGEKSCNLYDYVTRDEGLSFEQTSNYYVIHF